ncbi:MAG: hypothetical protein QOD77_343 [Thermoplasmata archaeon]|jgi:hypothetical protein|nr:hypothetical protein [Thermoplasmata archaeon]
MRALALLAVALLLAGCTGGLLREAGTPTKPEPVAYVPTGWADIETARIRPGVQVITPGVGVCTSNFLYRGPDNATLYLGVAAHCFGNETQTPLGSPVTINGIASAGTIAYSGWKDGIVANQDLGLVAIANRAGARGQVHPAVLEFGGPTSLGDLAAQLPGTQVITYGNSPQRAKGHPDNPREGHIYTITEDRQAMVLTDSPGIHGDSGSGLMDATGVALGVLSTAMFLPLDMYEEAEKPAVNYYVSVMDNLQLAGERDPALAGLEVVTWPLVHGPNGPVSLPGPVPPLPP